MDLHRFDGVPDSDLDLQSKSKVGSGSASKRCRSTTLCQSSTGTFQRGKAKLYSRTRVADPIGSWPFRPISIFVLKFPLNHWENGSCSLTFYVKGVNSLIDSSLSRIIDGSVADKKIWHQIFFHPSLLLLFLDPGSGMGKNQDPG